MQCLKPLQFAGKEGTSQLAWEIKITENNQALKRCKLSLKTSQKMKSADKDWKKR